MLGPGARLDVNELVAQMQTSRQPVLAAINRLAGEGFLRVVPQVGCWVTTVKTDEVADFFRLFALTEALSCELAALRRQPAQIGALRALLDQTARLIDTERDPKALASAFFLLNREFHGQIHEMSRSDYVANLAGGMWDRCDFYLASADPHIQGERVVVSEREHEAIVDAIERGDSVVARALMQAHIDSFGVAAAKLLNERQRLAA